MTNTAVGATPVVTAPPSGSSKLYSAIVGLASLAVLLQALWAGIFIREGQDNNQTWVNVHARGADVAIGLAIIATIVAYVKLRQRRDLVFGTGAFAVLLVVEAYIGGLVGDHPPVQEIHFPLAMALMGLAVWLPLRARRAV